MFCFLSVPKAHKLEGHNYVLDLVCDLELLPDPKQKTHFIFSTDPARHSLVHACKYPRKCSCSLTCFHCCDNV